MHAKISKAGLKLLIYMFNKTMRYAMQGLVVDQPSLINVKKLL